MPGRARLVRGAEVRTVPIRDEVIRLGQFLKLAGMAGSGADAKRLLEDGVVRVDGEPAIERGRQLRRGAVVSIGKDRVRVG